MSIPRNTPPVAMHKQNLIHTICARKENVKEIKAHEYSLKMTGIECKGN